MFRPEDNDELIGKWYRKDGYEYQLKGIMYDVDDFWWVMGRGGKLNKHTELLGCACNIEMYGFSLIDD